jgi:hypothetical protein
MRALLRICLVCVFGYMLMWTVLYSIESHMDYEHFWLYWYLGWSMQAELPTLIHIYSVFFTMVIALGVEASVWTARKLRKKH